ncbi:MAG: hypothetical protein ACFNVI_00080 [Lachnoanaerobaculum gingivalis]
MAAKSKTLEGYDKSIQALQEQMDRAKEERKKYEEEVMLKIGKTFVAMMKLDDKTQNVEEILNNIKKEYQQKKQSNKKPENHEQ